jgi:hypothetical protein
MDTIAGLLRDPVWQFVGSAIALVALIWTLLQRRRTRKQEQATKASVGSFSVDRGYGRHKIRKDDGILHANISSDFFGQFPAPIAALAKHLDRIYTPENFGHSDWLEVFKRMIKEEYFIPEPQCSLRRVTYNTQVNAGPRLQPYLRQTAQMRKRIMGLDE